jgi:coproporphyrinogen III oxidase
MKAACDHYFYLPSRQEHRGTGGIFFDDMPIENINAIPFAKEMTQLWMPSWIPIVQERNHLTYSAQQKYWQKLRRGRYLEFNLLYDVSKLYQGFSEHICTLLFRNGFIVFMFSGVSSLVCKRPIPVWKV